MYTCGWLPRFKSRHNVAKHVYEREAASPDKNAVVSGREELKKVLKDYAPEDVFNMDETGLFFKLGPNYTLASKPVKGVKRSKDGITVALCANSTGDIKIKPFVIAKARRPRCFGRDFNPEVYVRYRNNKKAWMTSDLFCNWLRAFDRQMKSRGRKVILLVDNAASHACGNLALGNVKVHFLPPNTTAHIQLMDAGIIREFKAHYRRYLVRLSEAEAQYDEGDDMPLSELRDLLNVYNESGADNDQSSALTAEQYVDADSQEETCQSLCDDDILDIVCDSKDADDPSDDDDNEPAPMPAPSAKEAKTNIESLVRFFETMGDEKKLGTRSQNAKLVCPKLFNETTSYHGVLCEPLM
ncbi:tigger transposable element-derived protein 6-like [Gigantopelta aegis]|uniref:tigger transposable element-derived protein 6-like n=1 Tax=Gigantopelta aegis TaxID=1735272 RepID=UPI001B88794C|nr:tigger transposable element-derived protein 6-like [Gigantopelta aegis]